MTTLPSFSTYGNYSSDNYGAHALVFRTHEGVFWFSYQTLVAFQAANHMRVVRQNDWGPTTGKHLNWIDGGDHASRVPSDEFERRYHTAFGQSEASAA